MNISSGQGSRFTYFVGSGSSSTFLTTVFSTCSSSACYLFCVYWGALVINDSFVNVTTDSTSTLPFYSIYQSDDTTPLILVNSHFSVDLKSNNRYFIEARDAYFEISNCVFKDSSNIMCQLIYWVRTNTSMYLKLLNTTFQNLTSSSSYSLIFYHSTASITRPIIVDNCTFTNITSTYSGSLDSGGLFNFVFDNSSYDFTFTNNSFNNISFSASSGKGSILYFVGTNIQLFSFQNNEFNNINSSINGTLFLNTSLDRNKFIINDCIFKLCKSSYGGAIYLVGVYSSFFLFIYLFIYFLFIYFLFIYDYLLTLHN
jgi:hypothetical protein